MLWGPRIAGDMAPTSLSDKVFSTTSYTLPQVTPSRHRAGFTIILWKASPIPSGFLPSPSISTSPLLWPCLTKFCWLIFSRGWVGKVASLPPTICYIMISSPASEAGALCTWQGHLQSPQNLWDQRWANSCFFIRIQHLCNFLTPAQWGKKKMPLIPAGNLLEIYRQKTAL